MSAFVMRCDYANAATRGPAHHNGTLCDPTPDGPLVYALFLGNFLHREQLHRLDPMTNI